MKTLIFLLLSVALSVPITSLPNTHSDSSVSLDSFSEFAFGKPNLFVPYSKRQLGHQYPDYNSQDLDDFVFPEEDDETPMTMKKCIIPSQIRGTKTGPEFAVAKETPVDNTLQSKIRGYISDWLEAASMKLPVETVNRYVNKIYELIYGAEPTKAEISIRRESDFEAATQALKRLRKAVVDVLNGNIHRPNVRNNLKMLADNCVSKLAVLHISDCPQTPGERHLMAEVREVRIMSQRAVQKLNDALSVM